MKNVMFEFENWCFRNNLPTVKDNSGSYTEKKTNEAWKGFLGCWEIMTKETKLPHIDSFNFSSRIKNTLKRFDLYQTKLLIAHRDYELLRLPNFGEKCLDEVINKLGKKGLELRK